MVGGLVEQQQVSRGDELTGQAQPAAFAAAQRGELLGDGTIGIEAEPVQDRGNPGVNAVAVGPLKRLEIVVIAGQFCLGERVTPLTHGVGLGLERTLQFEQLGERSAGGFPDSGGAGKGAVLIQLRPAQLRGAHHGALGGSERAGHQAEERGLATAVAADDAPPLPRGDGQVDIGEEDIRAVLHRGAGNREERHRRRRAGL